MQTVVVVCQHENWEDNAGEHDPILTCLSDEDFIKLQAIKDVVPFDEIENIIASGIINKPEYPIQIDGVFNIWYTF